MRRRRAAVGKFCTRMAATASAAGLDGWMAVSGGPGTQAGAQARPWPARVA